MTDKTVLGARLAGQLAFLAKGKCPYEPGHALFGEWWRGYNELAHARR